MGCAGCPFSAVDDTAAGAVGVVDVKASLLPLRAWRCQQPCLEHLWTGSSARRQTSSRLGASDLGGDG